MTQDRVLTLMALGMLAYEVMLGVGIAILLAEMFT